MKFQARHAMQGNSSISVDVATQIQRILALGFNTIELPFSFNSLYAGVPSTIQETCNLTSYGAMKVLLEL